MKVFISYRREDTAGYNITVAQNLARHFGKENIFMDVDSITPGVDFRDVLREAVASCDALVALIGPRWLTITDQGGQRRLDDPADFVRLEIATALARKDVLVVPALVHDAKVPPADELPEDLQNLAYHHAIELSDVRFDFDADRLARALEGSHKKRKKTRNVAPIPHPQPRFIAAGLAALAIIVAAIILIIKVLIPSPTLASGVTGPAVGTTLISDPLHNAHPNSLGPLYPDASGRYTLGFSHNAFDYHVTDGAWMGTYTSRWQIIQGVPSRADLSVAVDAQLVGDPTHRAIVEACRDTDASVVSDVQFVVVPADGTFLLAENVPGSNGKVTTLSLYPLQLSSAIKGGNSWNRLQLSCIGHTVTAVINGTQVARVTETHLAYGQVGIGVGTRDQVVSGVEARFVNLDVTTPRTRTLVTDAEPGHTGALPINKPPYLTHYQNGAYVMAITDKKYLAQHPYGARVQNLNGVTDSITRVNAQVQGTPGSAYLGVDCRYQSVGNALSAYALRIDPGNHTWLLLRENSGATVLVKQRSYAPAGNPSRVQAELDCIGSALTVRINGRKQGTFHDTQVTTGQNGLEVGAINSSTVAVTFRNLAVTTP